jgi:hypothetical protein
VAVVTILTTLTIPLLISSPGPTIIPPSVEVVAAAKLKVVKLPLI